MKLTVLGSSSAGNGYLLHNNSEALIIECGVRFEAIKRALNFRLNHVVGAIVSHEHGDHTKCVHEVMKAGIDVWATAGTHAKIGYTHRSQTTYKGHQFKLGSFTIKAFDVKHDALEPVNFLIQHPECGTVLFVTDTFYVPYTFKGLHNIIVEANYCQKIIDEKMLASENPKAYLRDRVLQSHLSIETCKQLLQANDLTNVNNIVLIHLSDSNSDAARFKREVSELTGKTVWVAEPGLEIPFSKTPF